MKFKLNTNGWKQNKEVQALAKQLGGTMTVTAFGKPYTFYPGKLAMVLIAAVLVLVLLVQLLLIPAHRTRPLNMEFSTGGTYTMSAMGKDLLMYNKQDIRCVNHKGEIKWSISNPMSLPVIEHAGSYLLAADLGGNNEAALYQDGEKLQDFKLGKDIISAKVSKHGDCAFATAADGYKGKVTVFNKKGKETFVFNSGDGYITDIAISDNGRYLAVAQMLSSGTQTDSRIQFIDLSRKKTIRTSDSPGTLIGELRYVKDKLISVSNKEFCGYSKSGRFLYHVSFAGRRPKEYNIAGGSYLTFITSDQRGNAVLEIYNTRGKLKGQYHADSHISSLAVHEDTIVMVNQRTISRISVRGKQKKSVTIDHDVKSVGVFGNGRTVLSAGTAQADILWIR